MEERKGRRKYKRKEEEVFHSSMVFQVTVKYTPNYVFEGRPVVNHITAELTLAESGKIVKQVDSFDFHTWASMASSYFILSSTP
jgi:hypothetical protein